MNKIIFLTSLALIMQSKANAQKVETVVPEKVQVAFKSKFPEAKKIAWEQESDNEWEGEFKRKVLNILQILIRMVNGLNQNTKLKRVKFQAL